ncbi:MAG: hypothetical protein NC306_15150 [Butyrivibrio sp.]|nr:hypothetical protein [Butyrivibrio sp.]
MDGLSVTPAGMPDAVSGMVQGTAAPADGAGTEKPETSGTGSGKETGAETAPLPGVSGTVTGNDLPEPVQEAAAVYVTQQDPGAVPYLETVSGQLDAISLQLEDMHGALAGGSLYLREGILSLDIILGLIAGIVFVYGIFLGRR